ncbi:MAG: type IV toxin-antitoxin system AbiEi family antitoxin domain-containing protein [Akkermansia sp.]
MSSSSQRKALIELAQQHGGTLTTKMVTEQGLLRGSLKYLESRGHLQKVSRGVYTLPDAFDDELLAQQSRYSRGIYALETALYLANMTDRTPQRYHMVFPESYNLSSPKREGILCSTQVEKLYQAGIVSLKSPHGNNVRAYCPERTLCDILRIRNHVDIQVIAEAFKRYMRLPTRNIPLLAEYAQLLHVERKVQSYLEVLL